MKILLISDTHSKHGFISDKDLVPADMIICAGDISNRGWKSEVENFMFWFDSLNYKYKILIAGNHDFFFEKNDEEVVEMLKKYPSITYLNTSGITIDGVKIWGCPYQPWFHNWAFNVERGPELKHYWDKIPLDTDILVTHTPPYKILDRTLYGDTPGCIDLLNKIKEVKPKLNIFGHIHEAYGVEKIDGITFVNASIVDINYKPVNKPILFEI